MLDPKMLRGDLETITKNLLRRGFDLDIEKWRRLDTERKGQQSATEELQAARNKRSREIGAAKAKGVDAKEIISSMESITDSLKDSNRALEIIQKELQEFLGTR